MIQTIVVILIFGSALLYLGRMVYQSFQARNSCATGCGKCGVTPAKSEIDLISKKF